MRRISEVTIFIKYIYDDEDSSMLLCMKLIGSIPTTIVKCEKIYLPHCTRVKLA